LKRVQFDPCHLIQWRTEGKFIRNNLIRIRVSLICKLSETPD
jgi:hypothetical protein